jgi:hypothetical protein
MYDGNVIDARFSDFFCKLIKQRSTRLVENALPMGVQAD